MDCDRNRSSMGLSNSGEIQQNLMNLFIGHHGATINPHTFYDELGCFTKWQSNQQDSKITC